MKTKYSLLWFISLGLLWIHVLLFIKITNTPVWGQILTFLILPLLSMSIGWLLHWLSDYKISLMLMRAVATTCTCMLFWIIPDFYLRAFNLQPCVQDSLNSFYISYSDEHPEGTVDSISFLVAQTLKNKYNPDQCVWVSDWRFTYEKGDVRNRDHVIHYHTLNKECNAVFNYTWVLKTYASQLKTISLDSTRSSY